jgi:hypothetical protein
MSKRLYLLSLKRRSFKIEDEGEVEACWSWLSVEGAGGMMDWWCRCVEYRPNIRRSLNVNKPTNNVIPLPTESTRTSMSLKLTQNVHKGWKTRSVSTHLVITFSLPSVSCSKILSTITKRTWRPLHFQLFV